jgi:hypothetical protein
MEKISWTDRVNNEAVLHSVKEERNILHTVRRRRSTRLGTYLQRNCLLSHIIEGKIIGTRRRGRRRKQLLDHLKEARRYWKLKKEAKDRILWRTQFGRGYGPVARQTTIWLDCTHFLLIWCWSLPSVQLQSSLELTCTNCRQSVVEFYTILLEEHLHVTLESCRWEYVPYCSYYNNELSSFNILYEHKLCSRSQIGMQSVVSV